MDVKLCDLCHTRIESTYTQFVHMIDDGRNTPYAGDRIDLHDFCLTTLRSGRLATYVTAPPPPKVD